MTVLRLLVVYMVALMTTAASVGAQPAAANVPIDLGSRRELMVDRFLIDSMTGASLQLHRPEDRGKVLAFDKPWEGIFCAYVTILHVGDKYQASIPSGRYSRPEEIANMVVFLCSDLASNTTGGQFVVDGGRSSGSGAVTSLVPPKG